MLVLACGLVMVLACLPMRTSFRCASLLDNLVEARAALSEEPPRIDTACDAVGDVQSRLLGEPGLSDVRPAWPALHDAADALLAVCGQQRLLDQPFEPTAAMLSARARWQQGVLQRVGRRVREIARRGPGSRSADAVRGLRRPGSDWVTVARPTLHSSSTETTLPTEMAAPCSTV